MSDFPPRNTGNVEAWSHKIVNYLSRNKDKVSFKTSDANPSDDGVLLYDEAAKLLVLSSDGVYNDIPVWVSAPATASDTGVPGQMAYDGSFLYICTATDTWLRVAIATW